jgi:hypothetical protein
VEGIDKATARAAQEQRHASRPGQRLAELARGQEAARLADQVKVELELLDGRWLTFHPPAEVIAAESHVFGPDIDGTGEPQYYKHDFTFLDSGLGHASANHQTGKFFVGETTEPNGVPRTSVAQVGMEVKPRLEHCRLSIRPCVYWSGFDSLASSAIAPGDFELRVATALGSTGIAVESWDEADGGQFVEPVRWSDVWVRTEPNPWGGREYEGVAVPGTGLQAETIALGSRRYLIWVLCRVHVAAASGPVLSTSASAGISCHAPFVVIEENPI